VRVGIVGGTFDPIHVAHIVVATTVHHALALDETRVVVAGDPYQKDPPPAAPADERFAAVRAAIEDLGVAGIVADDSEVRRAGPTYTIDTVEQIDGEVFLVAGFDAARNLGTWHRADELRELVTLVMINRPGFSEIAELPGWRTVAVEIPPLDVSSSTLRARLAAGLPVDGLVPAAAMRVVREYGRYAGTR
jgi:nicotinate-nucleotide adenylyltransferase